MVIVYLVCWGSVIISFAAMALQIKEEIFPSDAYLFPK